MKDDFYEGPPIEDAEHWHEGAVFEPEGSGPTGTPQAGQPTSDPSLSRAVDRDAAGIPPERDGYDRSGEGTAGGPLEPEAGEGVSSDLPSGST